MLTVIDLQGNHYTAISNVPRVQRVNGEREITLSFLCNDINNEFLGEIETGWKANFKGDIYHLFNEKEDKHGNKEFDAVLDFFHHFNGRWHVDEVENKSMTINDSIRPLFDNSDYVLQIIDNFYANTMSLSKQQNSTERFLYFIGRHKAEFNIPIGTKTVQLKNKIGVQRNDVLIHEDDNLIDFNINTDTGSFCTAIRYYYDFKATGGSEESTEKEPTKNDVYISPMADKYGVHYGEPIYDERFSVKANAEQAAKEKQESTWQSSFEIGAELFDTPLNIGDEIPFVVPSKSINGYIRVVEINEVFDEDGDLIEATYTFGNENIAAQYRKMQYDAIQDVKDMLDGKKPLPYSVLPKAMKQAVDIVLGDVDSVMDYRRDRLTGHSSKNEGNNITINSSGLVLNHNFKPVTAITHLGIVADAITSGTIDTNNITIYGDRGTNRIEIDGDKIKVWDSANPDRYTLLQAGKAVFSKNITILREDGDPFIQDGHALFGIPIITKPNMDDGVEFGRRNYITANEHFSLFEAGYTSHSGRWANFGLIPGLSSDSRSTSAHIEVTIEVANSPGGVNIPPVTHRQLVYRDSSNEGFVLNLRLPRVTYGALSFLLKFKLVSAYSGNKAIIRSTRCWISG